MVFHWNFHWFPAAQLSDVDFLGEVYGFKEYPELLGAARELTLTFQNKSHRYQRDSQRSTWRLLTLQMK